MLNDDKTNEAFGKAFYKHPLIKYLVPLNTIFHKLPSYIRPASFAKVVVDLLRGETVALGSDVKPLISQSLKNNHTAWGNASIGGDTLKYLNSIWFDSQGDIIKFEAELSAWFNEMMQRTIGWYKRRTQVILFFVGLVIAFAFNVDTITIVKRLQQDPKLRDQVIAQANAFVKAHPKLDIASASPADSTAALGKRLQQQASNLTSGEDVVKLNDVLAMGYTKDTDWCPFSNPLMYAGWVLTALALSLGAPFWFDMLNKIMQLRGAVAPDKAQANNAKAGAAAVPERNRVG